MSGYFFIGANPTVDLVVFRNGNPQEVLLIKRKTGTVEGGKWAIPGGFINTTAKMGEAWKSGSETPLDAAVRELGEETGLKITPALKRLVKSVGIYEGGKRDPRDTKEAWSRSHAFTISLPPDSADELDAVRGSDDASSAGWFPVNRLPKLAFDHGRIIKKAMSIA